MQFDVFGGFPIVRKRNRHGDFGETFWVYVREAESELPDACGCYIFAIQNGNNIVPWYVGKTERRTFRHECFQPTKINYYNEALIDHRGAPLIFLIARLTGSGEKFSKPTAGSYRDIDYLETLLIGMALEKNGNIYNVRKTSLLKEMIVPGIINSPKGARTGPQRDLRNVLGL